MRRLRIVSVEGHEKTLDSWGHQFFGPEYHLPFGYQREVIQGSPMVETVVVAQEDKPLASLTASRSLYLGPLLRDPNASRLALTEAIRLLDREVCAAASPIFADAYLAAPPDMPDWYRVLTHLGYSKMPELTWFWRPFSSTRC